MKCFRGGVTERGQGSVGGDYLRLAKHSGCVALLAHAGRDGNFNTLSAGGIIKLRPLSVTSSPHFTRTETEVCNASRVVSGFADSGLQTGPHG